MLIRCTGCRLLTTMEDCYLRRTNRVEYGMRIMMRLMVLSLVALLPLAQALAQGGPPVGGPPPCWPPPCIPVDGGISYLIGAGLILGAKRAIDLRKRSKQAV
jgi:hypothetical protein